MDENLPEPQPIHDGDDKVNSIEPKQSFWRRHGRLSIVLIALAGLLVLGGLATAGWFFLWKPADKPVAKETKTDKPAEVVPAVKYYSPLTGLEVNSQSDVNTPVIGAMIENSPDARPQSGLKTAGVVYEAIAEGGITRFMVLYQNNLPSLIGPVRSVRLYDVEWLKPYQAGLAHVGGSQQALAEIRNGQYRDLDQFFNAKYYWRSADRLAPHNVYTSGDNLTALNAAKGYTTSDFTGFARSDTKPTETEAATKINVTISSATYNSSYSYNATTGTYDRSQAGAAHVDREGGQISPKVVIVMKVAEQTVLQDGYREQITTIGSGSAYIFEDGIVIRGTWSRSNTSDQIKFTRADGSEIQLERGQTWLVALPNNKEVSWQ